MATATTDTAPVDRSTSSHVSVLDRCVVWLLSPVDIASLCCFRIGFGAIMAWWAWDYLASGRVRALYIEPRFHFTYYLFDWVRPWPGAGMYWHFVAIFLLSLCVACGVLYRATSVLLALCFTYVFLLDATNYQNHYYLISVVSWLMAILPAHRDVSFDATQHPTIRSQTAPRWALFLLRFHLALPYFFGGLTKLQADWFAGEPIRQMLASQSAIPIAGSLLKHEPAVWLVTWGGIFLDLTIVPLLLWKRTRRPAYVVCVLFHLCNAVLFNIHVFPWFMIFASTVFFEPDWLRRLLGGAKLLLPAPKSVTWGGLPPRTKAAFVLMAAYCAFHVVWPLRHHWHGRDVSWTEAGHYFAWRMLARGKTVGIRYYITDAQSRRTGVADLRPFISDEQAGRFARDPEMILHFAHFLSDEYRLQTGRDAEVRALVLTSLNGRKPQLFIDPNVDLAKEPRGFHHRAWIMPQNEPLRAEPWTVPLVEWERHVAIPPRPFLQSASP